MLLHAVAGDDGVSARLLVLNFAALLHEELLLLALRLLTHGRLAGHLQLTDGNRHVPAAAPDDHLVARQRRLAVDGQLYPEFFYLVMHTVRCVSHKNNSFTNPTCVAMLGFA